MSVAVLVLDALGWLGAATLLVAYALVSAGRLGATSRAFQLLNLLGSAGIAASSAIHHAWPSAVLNVLWMAIGVTSLAKNAGAARSAPTRDEVSSRGA